MAYPDINETLNLLGYRMQDKITGMVGVVTTITFDLYGCVQAALHPGLDKDGKPAEQHWYDVARLEMLVGEPRVMTPPDFGNVAPADYLQGPAEKPKPRAI